MFNSKYFIFLALYTILWSILIFLGKEIFLWNPQEEEYVDLSVYTSQQRFDTETGYYSFSGVTQEDVNAVVSELLYEKFREAISTWAVAQSKIDIHYIPWELQKKIEASHMPLIEAFLSFSDISKVVEDLKVFLYQDTGEVRGKMKGAIIHMFWVPSLVQEEFLAVFIHEFWHYFDIYNLKKSRFWDVSQKFYSISWESQSIMKKQLLQTDFVSGYAMTNQYEDFAESYTYYILHNRDFFFRSQSSTILREKYDFFEKYVFSTKQFYKEDFSSEEEVQSYYWDTTKIDIDIKKFLQYLQNDI